MSPPPHVTGETKCQAVPIPGEGSESRPPPWMGGADSYLAKSCGGGRGLMTWAVFCTQPPQLSALSVCTGSSREFCLAGSVAFVPQMGTWVCEGPFPAPDHTAGTQTLVSPMSRALPALFCFLIVLVYKSGRACRLVPFLVRPGRHSFVGDCYLLIRKDRGR